jgi:hypothetical protein
MKPKSVPPPKAMKDENTLKASVLVSQLLDVVQNNVHNFFHSAVTAELFLAAPSILIVSWSGWNTVTLICGHINLRSVSTFTSNTPVNRCPDLYGIITALIYKKC